MRSTRFIAWKSLAVATLGLSITHVAAQTERDTTVNQDGVVAVGGVSILTIRFPVTGMSVKQRADAVTERLRNILADPALKPTDIVAVPIGKYAAKILVKDRLLVMVEPETARFNSTTALELAQAWTEHLRTVLPKLNVKPNTRLGEPTGHTR